MSQSKIEWTEMTWNPVTGCTKVSPGCRNCYAEVMSRRLKAMGQEKYKNGFKLTLHPDTLSEPYTWKKSKVVFVNSMSDLFHQNVPIQYVQRVFDVMNDNPQHLFQILTKRAERLLDYDQQGKLKWSHNIWMGVSVENQGTTFRIDLLRETKARVKFLSCEPLLGPLPDLNLDQIDWVIVGGESGPKARPMEADWVIDIMEQCKKANIKFFFKQWGGFNKKKAGRKLQGKIFDEMPEFNVI
ncbi:MAG: phage Gp37/Gp68 family protein [Bacteroidales bacterium]|nr:phage Gp37/Gp68 family protein [Bacteroidales bacterium]